MDINHDPKIIGAKQEMLQVLAFTPDWEYYVKSFGSSPGLDFLSIWVTYEDV